MFGKLREKSEEDQATTEASGIIGGDPEDSRNPRLDWEKIEAFAAGGDSVPLRKTKPLLLEFGPHQLMASIWVGLVTQALLGMDILSQLNSSLNFNNGKITWSIRRIKKDEIQHLPIWAVDKNDCGLLKMDPIIFMGAAPPCTKQYPISKTSIPCILPIIKQLEERDILVRIHSSSNSHVWPVKKANGTWRLTIDNRKANQFIVRKAPLVADPSTIFNSLTPDLQ
ncbi:uncharacterized protein LOC119975237 isoform X1 [Scyliorhinus canicula]|uniref:uncharacterized protein LOC119975237 isoform X1 n=1 Tax=Scyliorhinus canicula TaxID=7830 RepID=UPI0018F28373|nr:uncharacterized protein LOC119975237 isoform X1 [Scyliorhinus canicula]